MARRLQQDEADLSARRLLVLRDGIDEGVGRIRTLHRQADADKIGRQSICKAFLRHAQALRQLCRQDYAHGDGFSVGDIVPAQMGFVFDGMAEGVAQVQFGPHAVLLRVFRHDPGLDLSRLQDERLQIVMLSGSEASYGVFIGQASRTVNSGILKAPSMFL